jgi:RHS repeat-associated protein
VKKTVTSATPSAGDGVENYYIDRNQIAFVTDGSGIETFHYLYGLNVDAVMAQDSSTGMLWSLADRLGSIDTLTDADGVVVNKRTFDSFGRVLDETNPTVSFRYGYTGRERDLESGLYYYRARYYDSNVGRFISVDPIGFAAGDTNLYRYVGNNSTNYTDPTGMWWQLPLAGAAIGALANIIYQGLEILEGSRRLDQFSVGQVTVSALAGAAIAPAAAIAAVQFPATFLATNLVLNAKGASDAVYDIGNKKPLSGTFDLVTSLLPFTKLPPGGNSPKSAGMGQLAMATADTIDGSIINGARELTKLNNQLGQAWMAMTNSDGSSDSGSGDSNNGGSSDNNSNDTLPTQSSQSRVPDWLKALWTDGEDFNRNQRARYPYNELYIEKPEGRVNQKTPYKVDSYDPINEEIISRKFSQLSTVKEETAIGYIKEIQSKYAPGRKIANVPSSGILAGQELRGQKILEVPVQESEIPQSVIDAANDANVIIRDVNDRVYNPK